MGDGGKSVRLIRLWRAAAQHQARAGRGWPVIVAASLRALQWGRDGLRLEAHGLLLPQRVQVRHAALQGVAALQLCPVRLVQVDSGIGAQGSRQLTARSTRKKSS
jgi:hypothetical protein